MSHPGEPGGGAVRKRVHRDSDEARNELEKRAHRIGADAFPLKPTLSHYQNIKQHFKLFKGMDFSQDDKMTRRVIAPYLHVVRRGQVAITEKKGERIGQAFQHYLKRKPSVLIKDLSTFLSDSVDIPSLLHETSEVLKLITNSTGSVLYIVDNSRNEIYQSPKYVVNYSRHKVAWKIAPGRTVAAYVAAMKEFVMVEDVLGDERFPEGVGWKGPMIKAVLCVPILTPDGECFAVIELYKDSDEKYLEKHLHVVMAVTGWMGAAVHQNLRRLSLQKQQQLNEYLLELTSCYFTDDVQIEKMIAEIVQFAKASLTAERGSFFVVNRDEGDNVIADLFDDGEKSTSNGDMTHKKKLKIRFNKERDVAGVVVRTGQTVNIRDAYADERFNVDADLRTGYITRSVLCTPIIGKDGVLGVLQVVNKKGSNYFNDEDENLFKTFAVYCSLALHYARVNDARVKAEKSDLMYRDMLSYHMRPTIFEVRPFLMNPYLDHVPDKILEFSWCISPEHSNVMSQLIYYMITSICGDRFRNMKAMANFLTMIRKSYRENPYHNYEHAFNVTHCMFVILTRNIEVFTEMELMSLLFSALCHDLDHRGLTNNFLQLSNDPLAQLYDESPLENHHVAVTMLIIDISGIFDFISPQEFSEVSRTMQENILATDLALYFRSRTRLMHILAADKFDFDNENHRLLMRNVIMTCCDLSGNSKPCSFTKRTVEDLMKEFYKQGDLMKEMGMIPLPQMDREKQDLMPEDQIQFLSVVVQPANELLATILPNTEELYNLSKELQESWREVQQLRGEKVWRPEDSVPKKGKSRKKDDDVSST